MNLIPHDKQVGVEEVTAWKEAGWPHMTGMNMCWHPAFPAVNFEVSDNCLVRISPTAQVFMDRTNLQNLSFPVALEILVDEGEERPTAMFAANAVSLLLYTGWADLAVFKNEAGERPVSSVAIDPQTWELIKTADGKNHWGCFGFVALSTSEEQLKTAIDAALETANNVARGLVALTQQREVAANDTPPSAEDVMKKLLDTPISKLH